jgi:predicted DNA-binding transcriptional regulator AlpA
MHIQTSTQTGVSPAYFDQLLNEVEAADFLGYTIRALQNWRVRGGGPRFVKVSARSVRYQRRDLLDWIKAHTVSSTAEAPREGNRH